jgi:lysophospholipase L1-like esterase
MNRRPGRPTSQVGLKQWITQTFLLAAGLARSALGLPNPWEWSIRRFEELDRLAPPAPGGVVFVGSSSFTLWSSLERDLAPLPAINRGFGGALIDDVAQYVERIVLRYAPSAIVLFAGTNDIAGSRPASPEYVAERFDAFVSRVRARLPEAPIFYIGITPSRARWRLWPVAERANRIIQARVASDPTLRFIDLSSRLLGLDGLPRKALYRFDRLHPSKRGYAIWAEEIRTALAREPALERRPTVSSGVESAR